MFDMLQLVDESPHQLSLCNYHTVQLDRHLSNTDKLKHIGQLDRITFEF